MNLNVPYAEKDTAKRLGARWNPSRRCWYVPQGVDPAPFARWLAPDVTEPQYNIRAPEAYLVTSPERCWRCGEAITVVGFLAAPTFYERTYEDDDPSPEGTWRDFDGWGFIHYITSMPDDVVALAKAKSRGYKFSFSKMADQRYWGNHCTSCSVLQGDFNLFCEPSAAFMPIYEGDEANLTATPLKQGLSACASYSYDMDRARFITGVRGRRPGRTEQPAPHLDMVTESTAQSAKDAERTSPQSWLARLLGSKR